MIGYSREDTRAILDAVHLRSNTKAEKHTDPDILRYDLEAMEDLISIFMDGGCCARIKAIEVKPTPESKPYEVRFNWETEYGEPQAWIYLMDGTSLEITYESHNLEPENRYYSARLHCSERDFENNLYHSTMGVIEQESGCLSALDPFITRVCRERGISGINATEKITLTSKTLASIEDSFEASLHKAMHELLINCLWAGGIDTNIPYEKVEEESLGYGIHNDIKEHVYRLFDYLGFDVESDNSCF